MKKRPIPLSDQVRAAIRASGKSQYAIAKATDGRVSRFSLCRFLKGAGLSLAGIDALGAVLGLQLRAW
jgi:hypothetical protein